VTAWHVLLARVRALFGGERMDEDLDDEIQAHLDLLAAEHQRNGLSADAARDAARRDFGGIEGHKEHVRDQRGLPWLRDVGRDLRHGVRVLQRNPGFASGVILTLALGIGMATAVFTVLDGVVLRPLPLPHAERLVWIATSGGPGEPDFITGPDFMQWHEQARAFDRLVAYDTGDETLGTPRGAARVRVADVTADYWDLSGAGPAFGRLPHPDERSVIVLSYAAAVQYFGDASGVIGRSVGLEGLPVTVVGVLPERSRFSLPAHVYVGSRRDSIDVFQPFSITSAERGQISLVSVVGRMKPGVTVEQVRTELGELRNRIPATRPNRVLGARRLVVAPLQARLVGSARASLLLLMAAGASVLLIAWANATNLLLLRAAARWREIAIRISIGASRGRVLRQLVVETLVLAAAAAVLGVLFAHLAVQSVVTAFSGAVPRLSEAAIEGRVLGVVAAMTVVTALVCSVAPALGYRHVAPAESLQDAMPTTSRSRSGASTRNLLVTLEVALTLVLLLGGGLMFKSLARMHRYPSGFEPNRILSMRVQFSGPQYRSAARQTSFAAAVLAALQGRQGVEAVSLSTHGNLMTGALDVEGRPRNFNPTAAPVFINATTTAFAQVMGLRLLRGRWFSDEEDAAVVNVSAARREFPGEDPIGHRVRVEPGEPALTIVGVVDDLKYSKLDAGPDLELFVPYTKAGGLFGFTMLVKTTGTATALAPEMRRAVSRIDPSQVADNLMTLENALGETIAPRTLDLLLLAIFAGTSLVLAVAGIYGVMAYSITQRTHEIGIRMALGASPRVVTAMVVRQGLRTIAAGVVAGLAGALAGGRFMAALLYEVQPTDAQTFAVVTAVLTGIALLACYAPALAIARIAPTMALRRE
jgi:putative ABC transport system permease protein